MIGRRSGGVRLGLSGKNGADALFLGRRRGAGSERLSMLWFARHALRKRGGLL